MCGFWFVQLYRNRNKKVNKMRKSDCNDKDPDQIDRFYRGKENLRLKCCFCGIQYNQKIVNLGSMWNQRPSTKGGATIWNLHTDIGCIPMQSS